jgi:glycosyltransferase involved in cell wall biosynthesis
MIKLSIVHPVLDSHEIVRRQLLHYAKMTLPDCVELIIVDDGSVPALSTVEHPDIPNLRIIETHDPRPWTWAVASNTGIKAASGEFILRADIDYIITLDAINDALKLKEDRMNFRREFGVLDENGDFQNDLDTLRKYGLTEKRIADRGTRVSAHTNDFVMRRSVFLDVLGGYREDLIGKPYPQGEDRCFQGVWERAQAAGKVTRTEYRPLVYMFPNGKFCGDLDYNPMGLFHTLTRK